MPVVRMPNGDQVQFPDDWSQEQIGAKIKEKFPEASGTDAPIGGAMGPTIKGLGQGMAGFLGDISTTSEKSLRGLPESRRQRILQQNRDIKSFAAETPEHETSGQTIGKFIGGAAPYGPLMGPTGAAGGAIGARTAGPLIYGGTHYFLHKMGLGRFAKRLIDLATEHGVMDKIEEAIKPAVTKLGVTGGKAVPLTVGGARENYRKPEQAFPPGRKDDRSGDQRP